MILSSAEKEINRPQYPQLFALSTGAAFHIIQKVRNPNFLFGKVQHNYLKLLDVRHPALKLDMRRTSTVTVFQKQHLYVAAGSIEVLYKYL